MCIVLRIISLPAQIRDLKSAVNIKKDHLRAHVALGKLLRKTGDCESFLCALYKYDACLEASPITLDLPSGQ